MKGVVLAYYQCDVSDIIVGAEPINMGKLETASLDEMIGGPVQGLGLDMAAKMVCFIRKDRVPAVNPQPGDTILGFKSSGMHSNGFTGARTTFFGPEVEYREEFKPLYKGRLKLDTIVEGDGRTLGEVMLEPTLIYARPMAKIASCFSGVYGINITGNGFKNFNRAGKNIAYVINTPFEPQPIFPLLQQEYEATGSPLSDEKMHTKFNMGLGFAVVVPKKHDYREAAHIAKMNGADARKIGYIDSYVSKDEVPITVINSGSKIIELKGY